MKTSFSILITLFGLIQIAKAQNVWGHTAAEKAKEFIDDQICDDDLLSRIKRDTFQSPDPHIFLFRVQNNSNLNDRNQITIHINKNWSLEKDFSIDTVHTHFNKDQIKNHIKNTSKYPLDLSLDGAIKIAAEEGMEKGIKPWKIYIGYYNMGPGKPDEVKWFIQNTLLEGLRFESGNSINISVEPDNNKSEEPILDKIKSWRSTSCGGK